MRGFLFCGLFSLVAALPIHAADSLLRNGDFETAKDDKPLDWKTGDGVTWETDGSNHFLRLRVIEPEKMVQAYRAITLPRDARALELTYRVRFDGIERGKAQWHDGRIMMNFRDADKREVKPTPAHPNYKGTSFAKKGQPAEWQERKQQIRVPEGAVTLEMIFALFNARAGTLDFDDIQLVPMDVAIIDAADKEKAEKEAARIAALPKPKPQVPVPSADQLPPMLRVVGNRLQTADGKNVWLQGVAIPSLEWSGGGEHILESIGVAIDQWKSNCVRLPIREHFWIGRGPYQNDGGMKYRQLVDDAVNLCASKGCYMVLDLHCYRAPEQKHADFWKDVAEKYKNHPAVMFDLLNEPHDVSWEVWKNGGPVMDKQTDANVAKENKEALVKFHSIGMQKLVDTVRELGAKNIVIVGGLDWAYDLSGILNGYALDDRAGNGIMYSTHVYPWKSDWQNKFLALADKYPLFLGEVGADSERMPFIPPERHEDPYTWVPDMLGVIQKHQLHWTAWNFHPKSSPRVLLDWNYTPTPFWGEFVKKALAGEKFETKKLR